MKKHIALFLTIAFISLVFTGLATAQSAPVQVGALKGPTAMGMVKLMEEAEGNTYQFTIAASVDEIIPKIVQGQLDITAVPTNLASVLYNNTNGSVCVLAINTLGVLYIVETGNSVQNIGDLRGHTLYASGKGGPPEYALNYILSSNGIDPDRDVTIEWKAEHTECVAALTSNDHGIAMLPQPFVTTAQMKNDAIRVALDMNVEWDALQANTQTPSTLITGVVIARKAFVEENPHVVADFMKAYASSVAYVNANLTEAAELIGKYDIVPATVAEKALPFCNIVFIEGEEMRQKLSGYLDVLMKQNEKSVGGALPDEAFYYAR